MKVPGDRKPRGGVNRFTPIFSLFSFRGSTDMKGDHLMQGEILDEYANRQTNIIAQRINMRARDSGLGGGISGLLITEKHR